MEGFIAYIMTFIMIAALFLIYWTGVMTGRTSKLIEINLLKEKLERYRVALIRGRKHHEHCYGDERCGCFCGLEKELEEGDDE